MLQERDLMREVVDEGCHGKDEGWNNVLEGFNV